MVRLAAAALIALALAAPAAAAPAPKLTLTDYAQLKTPLPYPYDEAANADALVDKAFAKAKASGKLLLVDMGGNWCGDCRILAATMEQTELRAFLAKHYEVVAIDVGRMDKNLQIPARWGVKDKLEGVPAVLIVDPKTNRQLVSRAQVAALSDARHMKPQALADWLAQWTR
jgi:thiol-disulfide isomerase/thioredoxin